MVTSKKLVFENYITQRNVFFAIVASILEFTNVPCRASIQTYSVYIFSFIFSSIALYYMTRLSNVKYAPVVKLVLITGKGKRGQ